MSTITESFKQAEFALASYASFSAGMSKTDLINALKSKDMPDAQATAFAAKWSVVTQYNDTATSLSATVFQEIATGKRYLAIRGTDPTEIGDLLADGGILLHGIPDLSNQYQSLYAKVAEWQTSGVLSGTFTVAGHSLGGWLAEGLAVDFAASIEHTYVYNSPGLFGAGFGDLLQQINNALGTSFLSVPTFANLTNIRASDGLALIAGLGQPLSPPIGILIEDQTQPDILDPAGARNHSQRVLTDSLALYATFAKIDPAASVESITKIIESASAQNGNTLELTLDALRTLFQQTYQYGQLDYDAVPTPLGDTPAGRDSYYTNLQSLQTWWDASPFTALTIQPLAELSGSQIAAAAMADTADGMAYRYAIAKLNPFAVTGSSALYDGINAHGELTRYNPATGSGAMSDQYIKDRAAMLSWKIQFGFNDTQPVGNTYVKPQGGTPFYFEDFTSNAISTKMRIGGGDTANAVLSRPLGDFNFIVFGSENNDLLTGQGKADRFYGGAGADTLTGHGGNDYLEGGAGFDTYVVNSGDGFDTVLDSDGSGVIKFGTVSALGSTGLAAGQWLHTSGSQVWFDIQNDITYTQSIVGGETRLLVKQGSTTVLVQGWAAAELGIVLGAGTPPADPATTDQLTGTTAADYLNSTSSSARLVVGDIGKDFIFGSTADDELNGGDGNDWIVGLNGADTLRGGLGDDFFVGLGANAYIEAGDGNDNIDARQTANATTQASPISGTTVWGDVSQYFNPIVSAAFPPDGSEIDYDMWGGIGNGTYSGTSVAGGGWTYRFTFTEVNGRISIQSKYFHATLTGAGGIDPGLAFSLSDQTSIPTAGITAFGEAGEDLMNGSGGADYLFGGTERDRLWGNGGDDVLDGGDDDDVLSGDDSDATGLNHGADYLDGGAGTDYVWGDGGADLIFGRAGADWLNGDDTGVDGAVHGADLMYGGLDGDFMWGDGGADTLYGEDGDDYLQGDNSAVAGAYHGNDLLDGGAGNDTLIGDGGADELIGGEGQDVLLGDEPSNIPLAGTFHGDDLLDGGDGDDLLYGNGGNDVLLGGAGVDGMDGGDGDDTLEGGADGDEMYGGQGNDTLIGGAGVDFMNGEAGDDRYVFTLGDGAVVDGLADTIDDQEGVNHVEFGAGVTLETLATHLYRDPTTGAAYLYMNIPGGDRLLVKNGHLGSVATYRFANGQQASYIQLVEKVSSVTGFSTLTTNGADFYVGTQNYYGGGDRIYGLDGDDVLYGLRGDDDLYGNDGNDVIYGGLGKDSLDGGLGDDTLHGGPGFDSLYGGLGRNTYIIDRYSEIDDIHDQTLDFTVLMRDGIDPDDLAVHIRRNELVLRDASTGTEARISATSNTFWLSNPSQLPETWNATIRFESTGIEWSIVDAVALEVIEPATEGDDYIDGLQGLESYGLNVDELIDGKGGNDTIDGMQGNDTLLGGTGNDNLLGGFGNDILSGGSGADSLDGQWGDDTYIFNLGDGSDRLYETFGEMDIVQFGGGVKLTDLVFTRDQNTLYISNSTNSDKLAVLVYWQSYSVPSYYSSVELFKLSTTEILNRQVIEAMNPAFQGTESTDRFTGSAFNDDIMFGNAGDDELYGHGGQDSLNGGSGNDRLDGGPDNDILVGGKGNDSLNGGGGADGLYGGAGDDFYFVDDAGDIVVEYAGDGLDTVETSVTHTLSANIENLTLFGFGSIGINGTGNELSNILTGDRYSNTLIGGAGNDTLNGSAGTPVGMSLYSLVIHARGTPVLDIYPTMQVYVDGVLIQEFTVDTASYTGYTVDPAKLAMAAGKVDVVFTNDAYRPDIGQDRNLYIQKIEVNGLTINATDNGVFYDPGSGAAAFDGINLRLGQEVLASNGALRFTLGDNDTLDGGSGADQMSGGSGNDTYVVDNTGDVLTEMANEGMDTVRSSISHAMGANIENLVLTGAAAINATGNELNNLMMGNSGNNILTGGSGVDTLSGNSGNDRLDGGAGNDILQGGQGNDTYVVESAGDSVSESANQGSDTVESSISHTLATNVENLALTGVAAINGTGNELANYLMGNSANNVLTGWAGNDSLDGGAGADIMIGGVGDDYYVIDNADDIVTENAGEGTADGVELYLNADYTLGANIEHVYRYGSGNWTTTGNAADNYLYGNGGSDTLVGLAGNDVLYGDAGADILIGGMGDDRYYVDKAGDVVIENVSEGVDTVYVFGSIAYTLAANVENAYSPFWAANLTGNDLDNLLSGSYSSDTLDGGLGADTLYGWGGSDTYLVDNAGDIVSETSNLATEIDTVLSSITYTLGANVESLTLTGIAAINGTGNELANFLSGNDAINTLSGLGGNDTIHAGAGDGAFGGDGDDTLTGLNTVGQWSYLYGEAGDDSLTGGAGSGAFFGGDGDDVIVGGASDNYIWGDEFNTGSGNDFIVGGEGYDFVIGGDGDDQIMGNGGNDALNAGAGADVLDGGAGVDTLNGSAGNDLYLFGRSYATDTVVENDDTAGNADVARFLSGVAADQIWFRHTGNDLEASIVGTDDRLVIQDWYLGNARHVERFETADGGLTLLDSQVENLVNAMAAFAPPASGQTTLPQNYHDALAGVIAASWQ